MADVTVTAANVIAGTSATSQMCKAKEAIDAGETVSIPVNTGTAPDAYLADASHATRYVITGVAESNAAVDQHMTIVIVDLEFVPGFTVTEGELYIQSNTAGKIAPCADLAVGMKPSVLGYGLASGKLQLALGTTSSGPDPKV